MKYTVDESVVDIDWVPDRHLGVISTLAHVEDEMEKIHALIYKYQEDRVGVVRVRERRTALVNRIVVGEIKPIPSALTRLIADALTSMRAAMEHALFTEAEYLNGGPLDEVGSRTVEMPCCEEPGLFEAWLSKNKKVRPASIALEGELVERIEALQPYRAAHAPGSHPLRRLASFTNNAKHRAPVSIGTAVPVVHRLDEEADIEEARRGNRPKTPVEVGDTIFQTLDRGRVEIDVFPALVIHRTETDEWVPLVAELNEIDTWVREEAVPRIITGEDPEGKRLPARYDITSGHIDERTAISVGTMTKSWQTYRQRFGAITFRESFAEWFSDVPTAPGEGGVDQWLRSLSDAEVIERSSRLTAGKGYRLALQNYDVLLELGEEAAEFVRTQMRSGHE